MVIILYLFSMDIDYRIIFTIVVFISISVPFIHYRSKLAGWLTSAVEKADNKKEAKENSMSQNIYILLTVLHAPLFLTMVYTSPYLFLYVIVYIAIAVTLLLADPWGLITNNRIATFVYVFSTFFAYLTILTQPYPWINLLTIFVLCISFTNVIREYTDNKDFLWYFVLYTIPYCIAYIFSFRPDMIQVASDKLKKSEDSSPPIEMNMTLFFCIFFFVLLFYSSTLFRNYYGGAPLISDPVRLNTTYEYKINPSYDYTLSYWVYFDSVPPEYNKSTTSHSNLVSCGYNVQTKYESSTQTLYVITENPTLNVLEIEVYPQRWNHVVLVSKNGKLDVYVNGSIEGTTHSISPTEEYMLVGQLDGIKGKLCSLFYSTKPYTPTMVEQLYQQLKGHNPPVL